jgi:diaminohydroxyphosphoribosylaminopyrimidine deaminase/5-amino-6-(5-phosphoribosylamino)uracil reductase
MSEDERFMRKAIGLARRGEGRVEPNPMVGAVLVRGGTMAAIGYHRRFGGPHAEVDCLGRTAPGDAVGGTLYVTLEPCCHTGKTGPCTEAVIASGVRRVVVGTVDPSPHASGRGIARLREAGIDVAVGVCEAEARELIAPFVKRVTTGLPWVIAKWAQTLDGKIATADGDSKWISGEASRRIVHELRARVDAVMVGVGTVIADDPSLTARDVKVRRVARRVIVDPHGRTPAHARVRQSPPPTSFIGDDLRGSLQQLAAEGATNVLVEGGATLLGHLFAQGLVDEAMVFIAPKVLGDAAALDAVRGRSVARIADAWPLSLREVRRVGDDVMLRLRAQVGSTTMMLP